MVYKLPDGSWKQTSSKTSDRNAAMRMALRLESLSAEENRQEAYRVVKELMDKWGKPFEDGRPLQDFFVSYRNTHRNSWSESTYKTFRGVERSFLWKFPDLTLGQVEKKHVIAYRDHLMQAGRAPRTIRQHMKYLKQVFSSAVEAGDIMENPASGIKTPPIRPSIKRPFTMLQFQALLTATEGEWHDLILFAGLTGQRVRDCLHARRENISPQVITLYRHKNKDWHTIPAHPQLWQLQGTGHLVPTLSQLPLTGNRSVSAQFRDKILPLIGITQEYAKDNAGNRKVTAYSFHSLRHMLSTELNRIGASAETRMAILGHEDSAVSRGYTHADMDTANLAINQIQV